MRRRHLLQAQPRRPRCRNSRSPRGKPDKLVFVGDKGPWHWCLVEEVAPAFEKQPGIKIDFTLLPIDALSARLKAELNSGSSGIDIIQGPRRMPAGWASTWRITRSCLRSAAGRHPDFDWDDFLPSIREMASYRGKLLGIPDRVTASILNYQKQLLADVGFDKPPEYSPVLLAGTDRHHQGGRAAPLWAGDLGSAGTGDDRR